MPPIAYDLISYQGELLWEMVAALAKGLFPLVAVLSLSLYAYLKAKKFFKSLW